MAETKTHFDVFDLPARYAVNPAELEQRYREASRKWHPDRFSNAPAAERALVLQRATDLNQAYRVLKNDARRAEYLLRLYGRDLSVEDPGKQPAMDPEFLGHVLELREELAEARLERDKARLQKLRTQIEKQMAALGGELQSDFARLEAGDRGVLGSIESSALMRRYYQRFLDEIEAQEEAELDAQATGTATL